MENCETGCPCNQFDCDLSLNVTDPVIGLEYLGIFETTGKKCSDSELPRTRFTLRNNLDASNYVSTL